MPPARYFQGTSVTGQVAASPAQNFKEVVAQLQKLPTIPHTRKAFFALDKKARNKAKEVPFFVPAVFKQSPSKRVYDQAIYCNLIFLDIDPEMEMQDGKWVETGRYPAARFVENPTKLYTALSPLNFVAHLTASSTPEKPRMRIIVDAEKIPVSEYRKAVATIGALLELPSITSESGVAVQPMFLPSRFKDSPKDFNPIIAKSTKGRAFTLNDITDSLDSFEPHQSNGTHGSNGENDLENLTPPNPDFTLEMAKSALATISPDVERPKWILCAAALRHQFPREDEKAFELFDEWSSKGSSYEEKDARYQWNHLQQTPKGRKPVTIGTLVKMATAAGWTDPREEIKQKKEKKGKEFPVDAYYDSEKEKFLLCNERGRWLSHKAEAFKRHLRKVGFSTKIAEGDRLSPAERIIDQIINQRDVHFAAPLAGRVSGFYEEGGIRLLVTDSPRLIKPKAGEWPTIRELISGLVGQGEHGAIQYTTLIAWMKTAYEALRAGKRQPGQVLALAGPIECGKSLLQSVITELLGGRSAKAWRYMSGRTDFNKDMFAAEHLMLEDEQSTTDSRSRSNLAAQIKAIAVNDTHSYHAKGRDAINLRPFWWMTISLNDEPEAMLVMPPMRADLADKVILLQCFAPQKPFPTGSHELRATYWQQIVNELPAFVQYLLDFKIPAALSDRRFGIKYFHHPELLESLRSLAPETKLLELIDRSLFSEQRKTWEGTAGELESILRNHYELKEEVSKLFHWPTACGVYLGKLVGKGRVQHKRNKEKRLWVITPPVDLDEF